MTNGREPAVRQLPLRLDTIEPVFAKHKALLGKAAERSVEALWKRIAECLDRFSMKECKNYFRNYGYVAT